MKMSTEFNVKIPKFTMLFLEGQSNILLFQA